MANLIKGVHHIALKCSGAENFAETIAFYKDILGLSVVRTWGEGEDAGIMFDLNGSLLEIFASGMTAGTTGSVNHFALACDDVDACVEAAAKAGYQITIEAREICIPSEIPFPARIAFCIGPVGEEIEFFCER